MLDIFIAEELLAHVKGLIFFFFLVSLGLSTLCFPNGCINLHPHQASTAFCFLHSLKLVISYLLDSSHPHGCEVTASLVLICISTVMSDTGFSTFFLIHFGYSHDSHNPYKDYIYIYCSYGTFILENYR